MKNVAKKKPIEREWKRNKQEGMVCPVIGERGGWALSVLLHESKGMQRTSWVIFD